MQKFMNIFRNSSIQTKLISSFLLVISLTTILITSLSGMMYQKEIINEQNSHL